MAQQKNAGAGATEFVSGVLVSKTNLEAIKIDAGFDLITEDDSSGEAVERITQIVQPMMYEVVVEDGTQQLANAQTQADYTGVGDEGTFTGGASHADGDVITLSNNANVTVTSNIAGVVSEFVVDSSVANVAPSENVVLTQSSTTGAGTGFSLTPGGDNLVGGGGVIHAIVERSQFDAGALQTQLRAIGVDNGNDFSNASVTLGTSIRVS